MSTISQLGYYKYYKPIFTTLLRSQYNPCILRSYIAKTFLHLCEALRSGKFKGHVALQSSSTLERRVTGPAPIGVVTLAQLHMVSRKVRIHSSQCQFYFNSGLSRVHYSSKVLKTSLNPWNVTGFTDGEGCFTISIAKSKKIKLGDKSMLSLVYIYMLKIFIYWNPLKIFLV